MEWVPCAEVALSLGCREGHCSTSIYEEHTEEEWVLAVGGYCEGERDGAVMAAKTTELPLLRWVRLDGPNMMTWSECDGASLTRVAVDAAYFFGGLDAGMNYSNSLLRLSLGRGSKEILCLRVTEMHATGDIPSPRARHSAGSASGRFVVFGGETESSEQENDGYILDNNTLVWTRITGGHQVPRPRLLAGPLTFYSQDECVLYGGAHFVGGDIRSMADVWSLNVGAGGTWFRLSGAESGSELCLPRSNGHTGGVFGKNGQAVAVIFVGGKDVSEGCNKVKIVLPASSTDEGFCFRLVDPLVISGMGPHWRYTASAAETQRGLLLLAGQCRHPQDVAAFLLRESGLPL